MIEIYSLNIMIIFIDYYSLNIMHSFVIGKTSGGLTIGQTGNLLRGHAFFGAGLNLQNKSCQLILKFSNDSNSARSLITLVMFFRMNQASCVCLSRHHRTPIFAIRLASR